MQPDSPENSLAFVSGETEISLQGICILSNSATFFSFLDVLAPTVPSDDTATEPSTLTQQTHSVDSAPLLVDSVLTVPPSSTSTTSTAGTPETAQPPQESVITSPSIDPTLESGFTAASLLTPKFWKYYFDVDTKAVLTRIAHSLNILHSQNFHDMTSTKPDLYGPFWITTSAILFISLFTNITKFFEMVLFSKNITFEWRIVCFSHLAFLHPFHVFSFLFALLLFMSSSLLFLFA